MRQLKRLKLFLDFWYSPWGAAKAAMWEDLTGDMTFHVDSAVRICQDIICHQPKLRLNWSVLEQDAPEKAPTHAA